MGETRGAHAGTASARVRAVRSGALRGLGGPGLAAVYAALTPAGPHRAVMVAIAAVMVTVCGLTWWKAAAVAASRAQASIRLAGTLTNITGSAVLSLLDGGVASPLGALLPFSLIFLALVTPPRPFAVLGALSGTAYWAVALFGDPAPPGYAVAYTLGFGGLSYLCLRHAGVLVSLRRRLAELSRTDPLTKALNRRGFDEHLESEFAEAQRTGDPMTLVLADLDRFKEINDTFGHQAGDQLLAWTAARLAGELRAHDAVGRLGGDEFAAVLPTTGPEAAVVVQRLRTVLHEAAPASIGYATYPADANTLADLRRVADARVYQDKVARDRVLPTASAVAAAGREIERPGILVRVSQRERRRRSIADMGWVALFDFGIGALYAATFAYGRPHQVAIGLLAGVGCATGAALVLAADRLARAAAARAVMLTSALVMVGLGAAMAALDGGATTVCALGMLLPMPLVALSTPLRVAVPVLALHASLYAAVAATVGASSAWYATLHLAGAAAVSTVCAVQGAAAARQRRRLTTLSRVDVLTDVLNRRGFEERFAAELAQARRTERPLSLLIFDLDGFKQVNDVHGHAAGDELLCWVATTLRATLHPHDPVGRLGGDEFVVLLTSQTAGDAAATAAKLHQALGERTGASVGAATLGRDGTDFDALYAHADADLYAQKAGRGARRASSSSASARTGTTTGRGVRPVRTGEAK